MWTELVPDQKLGEELGNPVSAVLEHSVAQLLKNLYLTHGELPFQLIHPSQ